MFEQTKSLKMWVTMLIFILILYSLLVTVYVVRLKTDSEFNRLKAEFEKEKLNSEYLSEIVAIMKAVEGRHAGAPEAKTTEEALTKDAVSEAASDIISDLQNLKVAAILFAADSVSTDTIKPEIDLLLSYLNNSDKFTKTPGKYLFMEADGKWWVGCSLAIDEPSESRELVCEMLKNMGRGLIFGDMDINKPYDGEDIVLMHALNK